MTDIEAPPVLKPLPPGAAVAAGDLVEAAGHPVGSGAIKPGYDPRLTNEDLAPLERQTWSSYNIFAFWMSDVHSVGGYITAGSLFALGLSSWQVLVALLIMWRRASPHGIHRQHQAGTPHNSTSMLPC